MNVTVFAKRDHLGANLDFCIWCESNLDELPVALYCASLAGSVSKIRSLKCVTTNIQFSRERHLNIYYW